MFLVSLFYLLLALLGLSFLVFVHELAHYFVAKRFGMKIEVFSIGFGPILYQWKVGDVQWKICILPFGGYVKIAGMDQGNNRDVPGNFYHQSPQRRILVALAGPLANLVLAFVLFTCIWLGGGQHKMFQEITHLVGYVDPESVLRESHVKPGDRFTAFDGKAVSNYGDLITQVALSKAGGLLAGAHVNYLDFSLTPFTVHLPGGDRPTQRIQHLGITPAQYLIFDRYSAATSSLRASGIEKGDRIVWVDGSLVFSQPQLSSILNHSTALLTLQRDHEVAQVFVPRLRLGDIQTSQALKNELDDWKHTAGIEGKLSELFFIPYQIDFQGKVEAPLALVGETQAPGDLLKAGDQIIAIDGLRIEKAPQLLAQLQQRRALAIVQRHDIPSLMTPKEAERTLMQGFDLRAIQNIVGTIGTEHPQQSSGNLTLLRPVELQSLAELALDPKTRALVTAQYEQHKKEIETIEEPEMREAQLAMLEQSQRRLMLGASLVDQAVVYNPPPTTLFSSVFHQTWKTLAGLMTGSLTPKSMTGPVGIVQALQHSWSTSLSDALYWLGFVSLNLAILNLLPIPVLDGGHIVFSLVEWITKKPIHPKTINRWVFPFIILLLVLFVYLTFQDIARILKSLF